ncbi:hypothetical protein ACQP00_50495 [Dactylosporangium sp. CS-047395]|uniref:hypothetical protein n=1 Tax=Dactylosporangium sp. CS-047395 TaxID=3239936 RepID=UPI003D8FEC56
MNDSRLRLDLRDLADEVDNVDLRDRVLRTSRRLGVQRAVASSAAVVVVLAAAAGVAFAIRPNQEALPPVPAATVEPSKEAVAPPAGNGSSPAANAPAVLTGTRWYLSEAQNNVTIHAVKGAQDTVVARIAEDAAGCVRNTVKVSPDGKRIAWVQGAAGDTSGLGTLMTSAIDGTGKKTLGTAILCLGTNAIRWSGADKLVVRKGEPQQVVDVRTGTATTLDQREFQAASPDGSWGARQVNDERTVGNGQQTRAYHYTPDPVQAEHHDGWEANGVSKDGRYITLGWKGTDPSREDDSFAVLDTTTSKVVALPVSGDVRRVLFTADGTVLVRQVGKIVVLDATFHRIGEVAEPKTVESYILLSYAA